MTLRSFPGVTHAEVEHSDDNLNALEDWLFETYAPEGCVLEEEQE